MTSTANTIVASMKWLRSNIDQVSLRLEEDWDCLIVVDGGERSGKTTLASHMLLIARPDIEDAILSGDFKPFLSHSVWNWEDVKERLRTYAHGEAIAFHEAALLGREAMTTYNNEAIRVLSTIGERNILQIWTWTRFQRLDPYVRERTRIRAYIVPLGHGQRGMVRYYIRHEIPNPEPGEQAVYHWPAFQERFPSFERMSELHAEAWHRLREKDHREKDKLLKGDALGSLPKVAERLKAMGLGIREIAPILGKPQSTIAKWTKGVGRTWKGHERELTNEDASDGS